MTNLERLQQAGLIEVNHPLSADEVTNINELLTPAEVEALISVRGKLGTDFFTRDVEGEGGHRMGTMIL
ncbi:MAG: hypothetical protein M1568_02455 [Acidobacteria bacterium]|jgi:hypothetical protein|nr:hypothetical protein [Acidobacteriota bacterium]